MANGSGDAAFLGVGLAFPVDLDAGGELALSAYEQDIEQAIRIILGTDRERIMRPDFGAGLNALAFEPLSTTTAALARHRVERALTEWEPRIDQVAVSVAPQPGEARLDIAVSYRVRATNVFYNLVYPFYLLEGEVR